MLKAQMVSCFGDVNPIEYGGGFVFNVDGEYEAHFIQPPCDDDEGGKYEVYRVSLDALTYVNHVLSDNPFHPGYGVWWDIPGIASCHGIQVSAFIALATSDNPSERCRAYEMVGQYHGLVNFDAYPLSLTRFEAQARYGRLS